MREIRLGPHRKTLGSLSVYHLNANFGGRGKYSLSTAKGRQWVGGWKGEGLGVGEGSEWKGGKGWWWRWIKGRGHRVSLSVPSTLFIVGLIVLLPGPWD